MPTSVFMACPTTRDFSVQYVESIFLTRLKGSLHWTSIVGQDIMTARNLIVERFLQSNCEYLLMHDSDATWNQDAVQRLVERQVQAVTPLIFMRRIPPTPPLGKLVSHTPGGDSVYSFAETVNRLIAMNNAHAFDKCDRNEILFDKSPEDMQVIDGAGAHFMLLHRSALEAIGAPWYQCTEKNAGEDFDFCRRLAKAGIPLYLDWSVFTGHVAGPGITLGVREFLASWDTTLPIPWAARNVTWTV